MVEKGSTLLEIKGAAFFVWDRKRWYWNKKNRIHAAVSGF